MSENLTPRQQILLWDLISRGGSALQRELKPDVKPMDREPLVRAKMISFDKKQRPFRLKIEESGWNYVAAEAPTLLKSGKGTVYDRPILQFVLASVQAYAATHEMPYADVFAQQTRGEVRFTSDIGPSGGCEPELPIETVIRSAFFDLAGHPARDGVRLRALRERLPTIHRETLDDALLKMRERGHANLMNLDNPRDIEAEGDAALKAGGQTFHLLWIDP